jgi:predicted house-cleaning noncanonical NTP pyrophosphatase (MazG superfamily)
MKKPGKLVRDRVPSIISRDGRECKYHILSDDAEYLECLKVKLKEEVDEFVDDPSIEELVDVYEVIVALLSYSGVSLRDMFELAVRKRKYSGGFMGRVFLEETDVGDGEQS